LRRCFRIFTGYVDGDNRIETMQALAQVIRALLARTLEFVTL
jgi:hypothetical protein